MWQLHGLALRGAALRGSWLPTPTLGGVSSPSTSLRQRLRDALPAALKAKDRVALAALRSTLAALDNAEAADRPASVDENLAIEQIPVGVGAAEVERHALTDAQVDEMVRAEVAEREAAAAGYEKAGRAEQAQRLRAEAGVLSGHLIDPR